MRLSRPKKLLVNRPRMPTLSLLRHRVHHSLKKAAAPSYATTLKSDPTKPFINYAAAASKAKSAASTIGASSPKSVDTIASVDANSEGVSPVASASVETVPTEIAPSSTTAPVETNASTETPCSVQVAPTSSAPSSLPSNVTAAAPVQERVAALNRYTEREASGPATSGISAFSNPSEIAQDLELFKGALEIAEQQSANEIPSVSVYERLEDATKGSPRACLFVARCVFSELILKESILNN